MIGLDTNLLIRYLVEDDPAQARLAAKVIETECSADSPGFINLIVLVELVWVLSRAYCYTPDQIVTTLEHVLMSAELEVEYASEAWDALLEYRTSKVGYADLLISRINLRRGCKVTKTFDRSAAQRTGFELLQ